MLFAVLIACLAIQDGLPVITETTFELPPGEAVRTMEGPVSACLDSDGRVLVLDVEQGCVYVWDREGRFLTTFGRRGQADGEFQFGEWNKLSAFIVAPGKEILVYDGGARVLHSFDHDFKFVKRTPFSGPPGRTRFFGVTANGNQLVMGQEYLAHNTPTSQLILYNEQLELLKEISSWDDPSFRVYYTAGGAVSKLEILAFAPKMVVNSDPSSQEFLLGFGDLPEFTIYKEDGTPAQRIHFSVPRRQVTEADQSEYNRQPFLRAVNYYSWTFAEVFPVYDRILPSGADFLVFTLSPLYQDARGFRISRSGQNQGSFSLRLGEEGSIHSSRGHLIAIRTNEDGDFRVERLKIGSAASR